MSPPRPLMAGLFVLDDAGEVLGLRASRCRACGKTEFPYSPRCPNCASADEPSEVMLNSTGQVFEYTTVHSPAPGFQAPYVVGYVDLPEGVRLYGQILNPEGRELREGDLVNLVLHEVPFRGERRLGYAFAV